MGCRVREKGREGWEMGALEKGCWVLLGSN